MDNCTVALISGGRGAEREISLLSAQYILNKLHCLDNIAVVEIELDPSGAFFDKSGLELLFARKSLISPNSTYPVDYAIPYMHGYPSETGDIQSLLEFYQIPFMGSCSEVNAICFNKITTKRYLELMDIEVTPYLVLFDRKELEKMPIDFPVFVKSSSQGSSIGCFRVFDNETLVHAVTNAFKYGPYVLIEPEIVGRELEIAAYRYGDELVITAPCEIICPKNAFYSYEQKYSDTSESKTMIKANKIDMIHLDRMKMIVETVFNSLPMQDIARFDFFLSDSNQLYLNEINTFPGLSPISMFPKMLESNGHEFTFYLEKLILSRNKLTQ